MKNDRSVQMPQLVPKRKAFSEYSVSQVMIMITLAVFYILTFCPNLCIILALNVTSKDYSVDWNLVPASPPAAANSQDSSFGSCVCDLTKNQCDPNCCCDPDCAQSTVEKTFSKCLSPVSKKDMNYMCVQKSLVTFSNLDTLGISTKEVTQDPSTPLFCVYFEGKSVDGQYYSVVGDLDATTIKKTVDKEDASTVYKRMISKKIVYETVPTIGNQKTDTYLYGDKIPTTTSPISSTLTLTYLTVPRSHSSELCDTSSFVKFAQSDEFTHSCYWIPTSVDTLQSRCSNQFSYDKLISTVVGTVANPNSNNFKAVSVAQLISVSSTGVETVLSNTNIATTYTVATQTCTNAVIGMGYYFSTTDTGTISSVQLIVKVATLVNPSSVTLTNNVQFINGTINDYLIGTTRPKSGNPGYIRKKPLLAGYTVTNNQKSAIYQQVDGLTAPTGYGCSSKTSILFDVDSVYSCSLSLNISELQSLCLKNSISQLSSPVTQIGRYGNADYTNTNDWVAILQDSTPSSTWDSLKSTCNNIAGGVEYQVVIAKSGSVQNEQWKVQGVKRVYYPLTWAFTGDTTSSNTFWIETRVRFVRVSGQETIQKNYPAPNFLPFLPEDVFYPFSLIYSSDAPGSTFTVSSTNWFLVLISSLLTFVLTVM
ncbi:hypothetical protein C9374_014165 [Naegleria lovaniensis]|uniref:Tectonic domain-containing protein n=1 Tax=Naegleria lovaniensis TaxID=51637 RepID=A0AA88KN30_NAELO|nr:uncharacterized protein C9374_014165 [Naegleria lovaniensis]KAG2389605.1 hypothetical protein C9374_014165 [Naegleria lovaniensis]